MLDSGETYSPRHQVIVGQMRSWMDQEVLGNNLCPPLTAFTREYRNPDGSVDWESCTPIQMTIFEGDMHSGQLAQQLVDFSTRSILSMIDPDPTQRPVSTMAIMPGVTSNHDLENLYTTLFPPLIDQLMAVPEDTYLSIREEIGVKFGRSEDRLPTPDTKAIVSSLVLDLFQPVPFYRDRITDIQVQGMADKGPEDRHRYLMRAPHPTIQHLNAMHPSIPHYPRKQTSKWLEKNTEVAQVKLATGQY